MRSSIRDFVGKTSIFAAWSRFCLLSALLFSASMALQAQEAEPEVEPPVQQVNVNTADAETLALALDGIGESRAMDIIAHREEHGPFESVDALQEVSGIGPATVERNRERVLLTTQ